MYWKLFWSASVFLSLVFFGLLFFEGVHGDLDGIAGYSFPVLSTDSPGYVILAENLLHHGVFSSDPSTPFHPETLRTPGYPLLLAGVFAFFDAPVAAGIAQVFLAALTVVLIAELGRRYFSAGVGRAAAVLYLLEPTALLTSLTLMSEALSIPLTLGALLVSSSFFSGVLLGGAMLARPAEMVLAPVFLFLAWTKKRNAREPILFLAGVALMLAPWVARNKLVTGVWNLSSSPAYNLYAVNTALFLSATEHIPRDQALAQLDRQSGVSETAQGDLVNSSTLTRTALSVIVAHPLAYARFHLASMSPYFFASSLRTIVNNLTLSPETKALFGLGPAAPDFVSLLAHGDLSGALSAASRQPLFSLERFLWLIAFLAALIPLFRSERRSFSLLLWSIVLVSALSAGPLSATRLRMSTEPFYFLLAASGASWFLP